MAGDAHYQDRNFGSSGVEGDSQLADDHWCDQVRASATHARSQGIPLSIDAMIGMVPPPQRTAAVLDGIIREALRAASDGAPRFAVAQRLIEQHPELASQIELAIMLDEVITTQPAHASPRESESFNYRLPQPFGPVWRGVEQRYLLIERLSGGRRALAFRAIDHARSSESRSHTVVIKILSARGDHIERMLAEAARIARVNHPGVVRVVDAGQVGEAVFIATEYVDAQSLGSIAVSRPIWPAMEVVSIAETLCSALLACHLAGVSHGDIHPFNVLLSPAGQPTLIDFGLGHAEFERVLATDGGALGFIAPEALNGTDAVGRQSSDCYALGALMAWMLTGKALNGDSSEEAVQFLTGTAKRRDLDFSMLDSDIPAFVRRATETDRSRRYANAAEMLADLRHILAHEPLAWNAPTPVRRLLMWKKRTSSRALSIIGIAMAALVILGFTLVQSRISAVQRENDLLQSRVSAAESATAAADARSATAAVAQAQINQLGQVGGVMRMLLMKAGQSQLAEWLPLLTSVRDVRSPLGLDSDSLWAIVTRRADLLDRLPRVTPRGEEASLEDLIIDAARGSLLLESGKCAEAEAVLASTIEGLNRVVVQQDRFLALLRLRLHIARLIHSKGAEAASREYVIAHEAELHSLPDGVLDRLLPFACSDAIRATALERRSRGGGTLPFPAPPTP